jgi:hypothetical protein
MLLLTDNRISPDYRDVFGRTPFSIASGEGHEAILKLLWATNRINPDRRDQNNAPPIFWALIENDHVIIKWLLSLYTVVPVCLHWENRHMEIHGVLGGYKARSFHDAILNLLLQSCAWRRDGEDVARIRYEIAIELLLERDNIALDPKYFVDHELSRHEPVEEDLALLRLFIRTPNLGMYEFEDYHYRKSISYAVEYGHMQVVELLIGRDNRWVNSRDARKRSPLYWAAMKRQKPIRDFLRSRGGTL